METVLPEPVLRKAVEAAKFEQRERKRDAMKFLQAMLISAASPAGGRQVRISAIVITRYAHRDHLGGTVTGDRSEATLSCCSDRSFCSVAAATLLSFPSS